MPEIAIKMLEVDLATKTSKVVDVTADAKKYVGGAGLCAKLLWDRTPAGFDSLDGTKNLLLAGVGPITALLGTKLSFGFKSPQSEWFATSECSGWIPMEIINAGYNAGILFTGKAANLSYLYVYDDKVEVRECPDLKGALRQKTEYELVERLRKETGETFGMAVIGPAGENLVRYAFVSASGIHAAGTWGAGAVMGSKNLKAIAVCGTKGPTYADHAKVYELWHEYCINPKTFTLRASRRKAGASAGYVAIQHVAADGFKNQHLGWHDKCLECNPWKWNVAYVSHTDSCPMCSESCMIPYFDPGPPPTYAEQRHGDHTSFLVNTMMNYKDMNTIVAMIEDYGFGGPMAGVTTAWMMDCYERGLVTKEDLGGIELKWGDVQATVAFLKKVAARENVGKIKVLGDGYKHSVPALGKEAGALAWMRLWHGDARRDPRVYKTAYTVPAAGIGDSLTTCSFAAGSVGLVWTSSSECNRQFLNAACGWNLTAADLADIEKRIYLMSLCFSLREGYKGIDDDLGTIPERFFTEPLTDKYGITWSRTRADYEKLLKDGYAANNRNEKGLPKRDALTKYGLDFVIPVLEPKGLIG